MDSQDPRNPGSAPDNLNPSSASPQGSQNSAHLEDLGDIPDLPEGVSRESLLSDVLFEASLSRDSVSDTSLRPEAGTGDDAGDAAGDGAESEAGAGDEAGGDRGERPMLASLLHGDPDKEKDKDKDKKKRNANSSFELYVNIRLLVLMLTCFVLIFTFVARVIIVSGPSMENTLLNNNVIVIWDLGYRPARGDVVVLTQQAYQEDSIVKRIIATGGQTVDIDYAAGTVAVDGVVLEEPYIKEEMRVPDYGSLVTHAVVPEGCLFVMGDNRNHSADSRYPPIGIIDERCVIGKVVLVLYPFDQFHRL